MEYGCRAGTENVRKHTLIPQVLRDIGKSEHGMPGRAVRATGGRLSSSKPSHGS
jgi:hypothetical protein